MASNGKTALLPGRGKRAPVRPLSQSASKNYRVKLAQTVSQVNNCPREARSRLPLIRSRSGACQRAWLWSAVNQLPSLTPSFLTPLTRRIPAAKSALSSPQSAASYARRRTAPSRRLMVPGARLRDSKCIRYRTTTVLLNDNRGSEQYQSTNLARDIPNRWSSGFRRSHAGNPAERRDKKDC